MKEMRFAAAMLTIAFSVACLPAALAGEATPSPKATDTPFTILYTGNARAALDVESPDLGGLARRSTAIAECRAEKHPTLLLDAGGVFGGDTSYDRRRSATYLQIITLFGYRAINMTPGELRFGWPWLAETLNRTKEAGVPPLLSSNLVLPKEQAGLKIHTAGIGEVGAWKIALVGLAGPDPAVPEWEDAIATASRLVPDLRKTADAVVALAHMPRNKLPDLAAVRRIDLIISADDGPDLEYLGDVPVAHCRPAGSALGRLDLLIGPKGLTVKQAGQLVLDAKIPADPRVEKVLAAFRNEVAGDPEYAGRAASPVREDHPAPGKDRFYVGAELCFDCHKDEAAHWRQSKHAIAFDSLYANQRHYVPDCQRCHTTGYGYEGGYDPRAGMPAFRNVQCEACHGPGSEHTLTPVKENIRRTADADLCRSCHDAANSPEFERRRGHYVELASHKQFVTSLEPPPVKPTIVPAPTAGGPKPLLELFVMSHCPYGTQAEALLFPWLDEVKDRVEFRLRFIARERGVDLRTGPERSVPEADAGLHAETTGCSGEPEPSDDPFSSLHGPAEVEEGIRQCVIMELYPEKLRSYVLSRNRDLKGGDWKSSAVEVGLDPEAISRVAASDEGAELFRRNIARGRELGARVSPSIFIDGKKHEGRLRLLDVLLSVCTEHPDAAVCTDKPECATDGNCDRPGKIGVCAGAGTIDAKCEYHDPVPFTITAINAPQRECEARCSGAGIRSLLKLFPYARIRSFSYDDPDGKRLAELYKLTAFPVYLFDQGVRRDPRFREIEKSLADAGDYLVLDTGLNTVTYFPMRREKVRGIDLWVEPHAEASMRVEAALIRHMARRGGYCNFHYLIGERTLSQGQPDKWKSRAAARYVSAGGDLELREAVRQLCIQDQFAGSFYRYVLGYNGVIGAPWADKETLKTARIPADKVDACVEGDQGMKLLDRNHAEQKELHLRYAPMVLINNRLLMSAESIDLVKDTYDRMNPPPPEEEAPAPRRSPGK